MKTVWKFPLEIKDSQVLSMPIDSLIVSVQLQNGIPCIWALVESESDCVDVLIHTFGTGHEIPFGSRIYVGTYMLAHGGIVFHVFKKDT